MFIKVCAIWFLVGAAAAVSAVEWDVAVTSMDRIIFLDNNATVLNATDDDFENIKAFTFNYKKQQFIIYEGNKTYDAMLIYDLNESHAVQIVQDRNSIQTIAVDSVTDRIFWTNVSSKSINSTKDGTFLPLIHFEDQVPVKMAIDICKRTIYWISSNAIEKVTLTGTERQVIVHNNLIDPSGLAIDQLEQRIYWTDLGPGIYFRIESCDFNGNDRQIFHKGEHHKAHELAIDKEYVYWIFPGYDNLWRKSKFGTEDATIFTVLGQGSIHITDIVSRNMGFPEEPNCDKLGMLIAKKQQTKENEVYAVQTKTAIPENNTIRNCVHGELVNGSCKCDSGFSGDECHMNICFNYCQNGICELSYEGSATCKCKQGFVGERCEKNLCDNFCLNNGACSLDNEHTLPHCSCQNGYSGPRCEIVLPVSNYELCRAVCEDDSKDITVHDKLSILCRCSDLSYLPIERYNGTQLMAATVSSDFTDIMNHPIFGVMLAANIITLVVSAVLIVYICKIKRMRPRIKKRVVVNKNITPLTYRPQSVEQCEITIEDCCNMNICETPCFEPRNYQTKKDEKKTLLTNMENNEELY